jgi:ElaA protein
MTISVKSFNEFTTEELYEVLRLRSEIFVVEQNCVYQDIDLKDQKAIHVLGYFQNELMAYTRIFKPGDYFQQASIGRVLVKESYRSRKWGHDIMEASIKAIEQHFLTTSIKISAQQYLEKFYNNMGFLTVGEPYLEDGIPHVAMIRN